MVTVKDDVEGDWSDLTEAVESFLEKVREESDQLDQKADTTLQALTDAHNALGENATNARNEIGQAVANLDALEQQATAHTANVEPLVHDGIEAPAQSLEERAQELETELGEFVDEARDFLTGEVVPAVEQLADDVRERCQALHKSLAEERAEPLQQVFDEWSGHIDELEGYVLTQGYQSSHQHALDVVEYVMDECETASRQKIEDLTGGRAMLEGQLAALRHGNGAGQHGPHGPGGRAAAAGAGRGQGRRRARGVGPGPRRGRAGVRAGSWRGTAGGERWVDTSRRAAAASEARHRGDFLLRQQQEGRHRRIARARGRRSSRRPCAA